VNAPLTIRSAPLPTTYQEARNALAKCIRIDECKHWAAKAEALASYARQMKDDALFKAARRIQDRAMIRSGELLLELEAEKPKPNSAKETGSPRQQAATEAGMSPKQAADAVAAAKVPAAEADKLIDGDDPPTPTKLAEKGRRKQPKPKPAPYGDEWCDWVLRQVKETATLPACGLAVLADHPLTGGRFEALLDQARAARDNLNLWIETLEERL
jgi:hypothetical protein